VKKNAFCDPKTGKLCVTVCSPKSSCKCGCKEVREALIEEIARRKLGIEVGHAKTGCSGSCQSGPLIGFPQKGFFYLGVKASDVPEIVEETLVEGRIIISHVSVAPERSYRTDVYYEKATGLLASIDDSVCMVDVAKYFLDFEAGLSCGKCVPCRQGLVRMRECLEKICAGTGSNEDLEMVGVLCTAMIQAPHCEFAMTSSRPVLSALTYFKDEFIAHIEQRECSAGVCQGLVGMKAVQAAAS
jgi:(2Fe-2S) ferredoxin